MKRRYSNDRERLKSKNDTELNIPQNYINLYCENFLLDTIYTNRNSSRENISKKSGKLGAESFRKAILNQDNTFRKMERNKCQLPKWRN